MDATSARLGNGRAMTLVGRGGRPTRATFDQLVAGLELAILGVDHHGVIIAVNPAAATLFDYPAEELVGQPIELLVPDHLRDRHRTQRQAYQSTPRRRAHGNRMRLPARRRTGQTFTASISLSPIDTQDGLIVAVTVVDITEQDQHEAERVEALRQLDQIRRLDSLAQLAGGIAHDFNNLLGIILARSQLLIDEATDTIDQGETDPRWQSTRADLDRIRAAAQRAAGLTRQLLTIGRRDMPHPLPVDVNAAITDMADLLTAMLGPRCRLRTDLAPNLPHVLIDGGHLEQVLTNLSSNARDAMPHGGTLTVATQAVTNPSPDTLPPGRYLQLQLTDTGTGMSLEVAQRAFDAFYTTKGHAGTGLGLATVHSIVTHTGGTMTLDTAVSKGTTVTALLPITDTPPPPDTTAAGHLSDHPRPYTTAGRGRSVLVVDDEPDLTDLCHTILTRAGFTVLTATNAAAALALAADHPDTIDLLLTDLAMPDLLGTELADQIRQHRPGIKIVYMSGSAAVHLTPHGADPAALLEKPFHPATLLATIAAVIDTPAGSEDHA